MYVDAQDSSRDETEQRVLAQLDVNRITPDPTESWWSWGLDVPVCHRGPTESA